VRSFWPYLLLPGVMSWIGFALTGLHPALGLLPVIPTMPHAPRGESEAHWGTVPLPDALDRFEAFWKTPVELILGLFALMNAGVTFRAAGPATLLVAVALLVGKPMGIYLSGILSVRFLPVALPEGIGRRELFLIGCTAGIGFTVALFVTSVAFDPGPIQDAARMGALLSGLAAVTTLVAAKVLGHRGP
jgi:NhaA family Na+:H+ antiporter